LIEFYKELSVEPNLTFNPGVFLGGTSIEHNAPMNGGNAYGKSNVVSKDAIITGDIRAMSPEQLANTQKVMKEIVARHLPMTDATITFDEGYPPLAPTDGNNELLSLFDKTSRDLGFGRVEAVKPRNAGAADISFTAGLVDMALDGVGLGSTGGHTVNETANLKSLTMQAKRTAILLYRLNNITISVGNKR
jgi:glutamate carboxypeptidase